MQDVFGCSCVCVCNRGTWTGEAYGLCRLKGPREDQVLGLTP